MVVGVNGLTFHRRDVGMLAGYLRTLAMYRNLARRMGQASCDRTASFKWDAATRVYREMFGGRRGQW